MTIDKAQLRALAEAAGGKLWKINTQDPNTVPPTGASHYNGQYVAVLSQDGSVVCDNADYYPWPVDEAHMNYMAAASPATTLALLAEIERLRDVTQKEIESAGERAKEVCGARMTLGALTAERDDLKAELAGLRTGYDAQNQVIAELRKVADRYHWLTEKADPSWGDMLGEKSTTPSEKAAEIDAAMAGEASHG